MLVSNKFKLAFVHIPKTGGSSFRRILKSNDNGITKLGDFHQPIAPFVEQLKDYEKITVVRNSWQICASCYRFESSNRPRKNSMPDLNMSFYDWLQWKSEFREPCHYPFPRQLEYLKNKDGAIAVDKIIKFENYHEEIRHICNRYKLVYKESDAHYYGKYDYKSIYKSDKDIQLVADICKEDIDYFKWTYESN